MPEPSVVRTIAWVGVVALLASSTSAVEISGYLGGELRAFAQSPLDAEQRRQSGSLVAQPEFYWSLDDGDQSLLFIPFARLDSADAQRTHVDVREALWQTVGEDWELRMGIGKVFWGVTESRHLVDVINQSDLVEDPDGEDKLGQPMINYSHILDWGTVDLFVLPGFRERTFPGPSGRLRSIPPVDTDAAIYESSAENWHIDWAARWSHVLGNFDIGISHFWGTSREPVLSPGFSATASPVLVPRYDIIHQTGLDLQATLGDWLWKVEAIRRTGQGETFFAVTGGFEYTFIGVGGGDADLGALFEYNYDERGEAGGHPFEDDLFFGLRLALNDAQSSELLAGVTYDVEGDGSTFNLEASRRLSDHWTIAVEGRAVMGVRPADPLYSFRKDDYLQFTLLRYF